MKWNGVHEQLILLLSIYGKWYIVNLSYYVLLVNVEIKSLYHADVRLHPLHWVIFFLIMRFWQKNEAWIIFFIISQKNHTHHSYYHNVCKILSTIMLKNTCMHLEDTFIYCEYIHSIHLCVLWDSNPWRWLYKCHALQNKL